MAVEPKEPALNYQVQTNLTCNLRCSYCYETLDGQINKIEDIEIYLRALFERDKDSGNDSRVLDLIGGEALVVPDLVEKAIDVYLKLCDEYGIPPCRRTVSLCSNGTTLTMPRVQQLLLKYKRYVKIGISIDGTREQHNKYRVYHHGGGGSYDDAVAGLRWVQANFCSKEYGVKATYRLDDLPKYAENVIALFELGFREVPANIVFEDIITPEYANEVYNQLAKVIDYLFENRLMNDRFSFQIAGEESFNRFIREDGHFEFLISGMRTAQADRDRNNCGSTSNMTCLGFDRKIYGCNRFCAMAKENRHHSVMADDGTFEVVDPHFKKSVIDMWKFQPVECRWCPVISGCPVCVAAPFDEVGDWTEKDLKIYSSEKRQCGWTLGATLARKYFEKKYNEALDGGLIERFVPWGCTGEQQKQLSTVPFNEIVAMRSK